MEITMSYIRTTISKSLLEVKYSDPLDLLWLGFFGFEYYPNKDDLINLAKNFQEINPEITEEDLKIFVDAAATVKINSFDFESQTIETAVEYPSKDFANKFQHIMVEKSIEDNVAEVTIIT